MEVVDEKVKIYFRFCPLCFAEGSIEPELHGSSWGVKDYITCTNCGAKWHIYIDWDYPSKDFRWAKLVIDNIDKKGAPLLGKQEEPEFWQHMALKGRREIPQVKEEQPPIMVREKEVIREIVKVRCRHCGTLCLETLNKCPNCGASL